MSLCNSVKICFSLCFPKKMWSLAYDISSISSLCLSVLRMQEPFFFYSNSNKERLAERRLGHSSKSAPAGMRYTRKARASQKLTIPFWSQVQQRQLRPGQLAVVFFFFCTVITSMRCDRCPRSEQRERRY